MSPGCDIEFETFGSRGRTIGSVSERVARRLFVSGHRDYMGPEAESLCHGLEGASLALTWSQIGAAPLEAIGELIPGCDGMLALVNPVWASSTYHSAEISFALGEASFNDDGRPLRNAPLPVFAYIEDVNRRVQHWIQGRIQNGSVLPLPHDPKVAAIEISTLLRRQGRDTRQSH